MKRSQFIGNTINLCGQVISLTSRAIWLPGINDQHHDRHLNNEIPWKHLKFMVEKT